MASLGNGIIQPIGIQGLTNLNHNLANLNHSHSISLSNISGYGSDRDDWHPSVKKYEIVEIEEDLLALSVAKHRLNKVGIRHGMLDKQLFEKVTSDDRTNADKMRDFYSKKIMMWKLKGNKLTNFRNDLNSFIHGDGNKFKESSIGLAYYIPYFYDYDSQMDIVRSQCTNVSYGKLGSIIDKVNPQKFIPLQCIESIRRSTQEYHYWLKHDTTNNGLLVAIDKKNELNHLFKHFFNSKNTLEFKGKLFTKNREDFEYYTIKNWELTNV